MPVRSPIFTRHEGTNEFVSSEEHGSMALCAEGLNELWNVSKATKIQFLVWPHLQTSWIGAAREERIDFIWITSTTLLDDGGLEGDQRSLHTLEHQFAAWLREAANGPRYQTASPFQVALEILEEYA